MPASTYLAQAILNAIHGKTSALGALGSAPAHFFIALSSTNPGASGSGITEPSGGSYARVSTAPADWSTASAADPSVITNANIITFAAPTADWVSGANIAWFARFDAITSGHMLDYGTIVTPKAYLNGAAAPTYPVGNLVITFPSS